MLKAQALPTNSDDGDGNNDDNGDETMMIRRSTGIEDEVPAPPFKRHMALGKLFNFLKPSPQIKEKIGRK